MYRLVPSNDFQRQLGRLQFSGRGIIIRKLNRTITLLANGQPLPPSARDHKLSGPFEGYSECHVDYDWLLIYKIEKEKLILALVATGTHDQLFG